MKGRVFTILGNSIEVHSTEGVYRCRFRGKAKRERNLEMTLTAVGDQVEFTDLGQGEGVIEKVLPRKSRLSRHDPASPKRELVIVANLDAVLIVAAAKSPDLDPLTIDKCLVLAAAGGLPAAIALNKMDLAPAGTAERVAVYPPIGVPLFLTCALRSEGLDPLRAWMKGKMVALLGPSGVGKSSLVNALQPELSERTGAVSERRGTGKHTTTWATVFETGEGLLVDTPGLEYFTAWGVTPLNLHEHFTEFASAGGCKFRNCIHVTEPSCAVRAAVEAGRVARSRYDNYLAIRAILSGRRALFS